MNLYRKYFVLLFIIISAILSAGGCGRKTHEAPPEAAKPVKLSRVPTGTINREINFTGTFVSRNRTEVLPRYSGRVTGVFFEEGDRVEAGQLLVQLEDDDLKAQLNQSLAAVEVARARLGQAQSGYKLTSTSTVAQVGAARQGVDLADEGIKQAEASYQNALAEYNRMSNLFQKGAISRQTLDNVTTQYRIARSRLDAARTQKLQARENLHVAKANTNQSDVSLSDISAASAGITQAQANVEYLRVLLGFTRIKAPMAGVITIRGVEPGQLVAPGDKTPIAAITDNSIVYMESVIPESEIQGISVGDTVNITVKALGDRKFTGHVQSVIPTADPKSRTFRIKVSVDNPREAIKNGMSARAEMLVEELSGIVIPRHWLKIIEGEFYVAQPNDENRAVHKKISLAYYNEEKALVREGLQAGEKLVSVGQDILRDGDLLDIQGEVEPQFHLNDNDSPVEESHHAR